MTLRILVADDARHNRVLASEWIKELGHETLQAADGLVAWKHAQLQRFDLIVTDIEMPGQSGLELLQQIRGHADQRISEVPVIVMTSLQDGLLEEIGCRFGATTVIRKPLVKADFQKVIREATEKGCKHPQKAVESSGYSQAGPHQGPISPTLRRIIHRALNDL